MGRQREFNERDALDAAMQVFWRQGYGETSIDDLVQATGVSRYGLYSAFGDKNRLFLAALEHYQRRGLDPALLPLERPHASLAEVREFFRSMATAPRPVNRRHGCLMCSTMAELASDDPQVAERCRAFAERVRGKLRTALARARARGELGASTDVEALSASLIAQMVGLSTLAKSPGTEALRDDALRAIELLLEPAPREKGAPPCGS